MAVFPGDVIVGDDDSVIVIPRDSADEIAAEAVDMTAYENFVIEEVKNGASIIGLYPATNEDSLKRFEAWKGRRDR